jgi:hypothetical protein
VIAMGKHHPDPKVITTIKLAIGECQLGQHLQIGSVSFLGPIQPHQENVSVNLSGDERRCGLRHTHTLLLSD